MGCGVCSTKRTAAAAASTCTLFSSRACRHATTRCQFRLRSSHCSAPARSLGSGAASSLLHERSWHRRHSVNHATAALQQRANTDPLLLTEHLQGSAPGGPTARWDPETGSPGGARSGGCRRRRPHRAALQTPPPGWRSAHSRCAAASSKAVVVAAKPVEPGASICRHAALWIPKIV